VRKVEQGKKEGTSKLQRIMDKQNINDHELYEKSGVHFNTIGNIRKGICKTPKFKTLRKLAKALGCTAREIGG
jgi:DNA-binding helix-turn-helix protein